jgi:hypothetical protein
MFSVIILPKYAAEAELSTAQATTSFGAIWTSKGGIAMPLTARFTSEFGSPLGTVYQPQFSKINK